ESFQQNAAVVLKQTGECLFEEVSAYGEPAEVTEMRDKILNTQTTIVKGDTYIPGKTYTGKAYYVSNNGNDENDGLSPETAWATLDRINDSITHDEVPIESGDAIFFERGGFWRGHLMIWWTTDITISAYGRGEKPIITSSPESGADEEKWELVHEGENGEKIWKFYQDMTDTGMIVLNDEMSAQRVTPRWTGSAWVNWDGTPFDVKNGLTKDLDYFVDIGDLMPGTTEFFDYQDSPYVSYGALHLRCDAGNPGAVFESIEFASMIVHPSDSSRISSPLSLEPGNTLDNICVKYYPMGGSGNPNNGAVQNCEFAWGGGGVQFVHDGYITGRMGDALFGAWLKNCTVRNNYFHDLFSHAMIIEGSIEHGDGGPCRDIIFADNLVVNSAGLNYQQERGGFESLNITGNIFFNNENHWGAEYSWNGGWASTEYWKFIRFQRGSDSLETYYESCSVSDNSFYYPLQFFLVSGIDQSMLPEFGNNAYYLAENSMGFASWIVNPNGGSFEPVFKDNAEVFLREYLKDETSVIVRPGESYVREPQDDGEANEMPIVYEEMAVGSKGEHVQILQQLLINRRYLSDSADGVFGKKTAEAVKNAQADFGLEQTGVADEAFLRVFCAS
ncbi:MAG: peptidoglycan-binding protein, partial [Clostridia bacterium]|nr:peptidoglycan-binding protein [Clostridia bacterium]